MATSDVAVNLEVTPLTHENATYCLVEDAKGEVSFTTEKLAQKAVEKGEATIKVSQTFAAPVVNNFDGFTQLIPSEKERLRLVGRSVDGKFYQIVRATMLEQDKEGNYIFQPKEGVMNVDKDIAEESTGRASTPEDKVEKILSGLSGDAAQEVLKKLMARIAAQQVQTA